MTTYRTEVIVPRLHDPAGGNWDLRQLKDISVLFGKNGSGKSLLMRALRDTNPEGFHYVVPERTGEITFNPGLMQQQMDGAKRKDHAVRNYTPQYRELVISRIQTYFLTRGGREEGTPIPGSRAELEDFLSQLIPDFKIELRPKDPPYQITRLSNGQPVAVVADLSSGESQLLTIAIDVLTIAAIWELEAKHERIVLLDEPDAHIHPDLQVRLADFLVGVAKRFELQLVVATHSTTLLAALGQFGGDLTAIIYLDRNAIFQNALPFDAVRKQLTACLGGHALMGPLFAAPLLLVEGDDDYRIWSQVPRHHKVRLSALPANGDEIFQYQKALEQVFGSLNEAGRDPLGYALLDGDKAKPQPDPTNRQAFVRFIRLNCHEAENLFISDEVLGQLDLTWAQAVERIITAAPKHGNKAAALLDVGAWDRRHQDIKNYINEISKALDDKNVHWTTRVGSTLGNARPTGMLADFLGEEVVSALWGSIPPAIAA